VNTLWRPVSPCGPGCLPPADSIERVSPLVMAWRVASAVSLLAVAVPAVILAAALRLPTSGAVRALCRILLTTLGVRHSASRPLSKRPAMIVANHVSWLDVLVILAYSPARLLAKRDVLEWPVIGWLAAAIGTIFVDRYRPRQLPTTVATVRAALRAGRVVAVFPEGTTWCGQRNGRFRPALFQAAIDARVPVIPVSLTFRAGPAPTTLTAYVGEDTLIASLRRVVSARGLSVSLRAHAALHPAIDAGRRSLANAADGRVHSCAINGSLLDQYHHESARTVHALDPRQLDIAGRRRAADERQRSGRVESRQQLRDGLHDVSGQHHTDVPVGDQGDRAPTLAA
jgi:1-acyl-sn-glycerol-3-phosphate acyltransferase